MFYVIAILLLPIIGWQAMRIRKNARELPEAAGLREGVTGKGKPLSVLYVGDSAAAGVGVAHIDDSLVGRLNDKLSKHYAIHWQLVARTGNTTKDSLAILRQLNAGTFDLAIVSLGVNDVTSVKPISVWWKSTASLIYLLRHKFKCQQVIYTCVPPMGEFPALSFPLNWLLGWRALQLNAVLKNRADNISYLHLIEVNHGDVSMQIADDGFHPNQLGYEVWANQVAQLILEKLNFQGSNQIGVKAK